MNLNLVWNLRIREREEKILHKIKKINIFFSS
jgi:hypothetical protein